MRIRIGASIALAIATSNVSAQSSTTLYGTVDSGILQQTSSASSYSTKSANAGGVLRYKDGGVYTSLFGIRVVEDLGGGYMATAQFQGGFDTGTGKVGLGDSRAPSSSLFNMIAAVDLSGSFGSVKLGRQFAPMYLALVSTDVRHAEYFGSILTALLGMNSAAGWVGASTDAAIGAVYDSNAIVYKSPKFAGFNVMLEYAVGGVAGSFQANSRQSAVVQYDNFGLKVAAIYYKGHDTNPGIDIVSTGVNNNRLLSLSALYTRGAFSIGGSFSNGRNPSRSNEVDFNVISGGIGYRFTPVVSGSSAVYYLADKNHSSNRSMAFVLSVNYLLSKVTTIYADIGYVNNRGEMNQALVFGSPVAPGVGTTALMMGVRHNF